MKVTQGHEEDLELEDAFLFMVVIGKKNKNWRGKGNESEARKDQRVMSTLKSTYNVCKFVLHVAINRLVRPFQPHGLHLNIDPEYFDTKYFSKCKYEKLARYPLCPMLKE